MNNWTVLRHGGRRTDSWRVVYWCEEMIARQKFREIEQKLRQGGVKLLDPTGLQVLLVTAPRLRTRW